MKPLRALAACLLAAALCQGCAQTPAPPDRNGDNNAEGNVQGKQVKARQSGRQGQGKGQTGRQQNATPDLEGGDESRVRMPKPMSLADLHRKYPTYYKLNGPRTKRQAALTFDDAPDAEFTPQVLDALKQAGVKATFFVVGNRIEAHPDIMARIVREGHEIGNHSYSHPNLPKLSDARFRSQIIRTDRIIERHTGAAPALVRPPYGNIDEDQIRWLASKDKRVIGWNVDSLDWKGLNADQVCINVLGHIVPGSIILQHSGGGKGEDLSGTVAAIPRIVRALRRDGVEFVTVSTLLELKKDTDARPAAER